MNKYFDLTGMLAAVTGGRRGIGLAIARGLAESGAQVIVCGRSIEGLEPVLAELGNNAGALVTDISDEQSVAAAARHIQQQYGKLDILVNNAGINPHYASMERTSGAGWGKLLQTNLNGVFYCCKHLGELMLAARRGSIINISSIAGHIALKHQVPYCASKGGVEQLTKALAYDWVEHNIRVNAIGYGFIKTDLTSAMINHKHIAPRLLARTPLGRFDELNEVAAAAIFLASPGASYVTGHTVMVDGGWTAA